MSTINTAESQTETAPLTAYNEYLACSKQLCELTRKVKSMQTNILSDICGNVLRVEWDTESEYDDAGGYYTYPHDVRLIIEGKDCVFICRECDLMDDEAIDTILDIEDECIEIPSAEAMSDMDGNEISSIYRSIISKYAGIKQEHAEMFFTLLFDFIEDNPSLCHLGLSEI